MSFETSTLAFLQVGSGAVGRTIDSKLKEQLISVKDYGAIGDGVTDDTAAITAALAQINSTGGTLYFPTGVYLDSAKRILTGPQNAGDALYGHITIKGDGTTSVWRYTGAGVFIQSGGGGGIASISVANPTVITTADAHGLVTGETVTIINTAATPDVDGSQVVTVTGATTFTVPVNVTVGTAAAGVVKTSRTSAWNTFKDIVIESTGAVGSKVGIELMALGYQINFDNVWIEAFFIGIRSDDNNGCGMYNSTVIGCTTGVALGRAAFLWTFFRSYFNTHTVCGVDIGYYDARIGVQAPPAGGVVFIGCGFHLSNIPLVIGGNSTEGVMLLGCYIEDNTLGIQIGHNAASYSGNQLESGDLNGAAIFNTFIAQAANNVIVINRAIRNLEAHSMRISNLGAGVAVVKSISAATDIGAKDFQGLRSPCYEDFAAVQVARNGYQNGQIIQARLNSTNNGFIEIVRNAATDYGLLRFFSTIGATTPDFEIGQYATTDLAIVMAGNGASLWKINRTTGRQEVRAGFSNVTYAPTGGTLTFNTTAVGNITTGEDNLMTYSLPASVLAVNGESLEVICSGTIANTAGQKRIKAFFGATTILDTGALGLPVSTAIDWYLRAQIIRTGAATQKCIATLVTSDATFQSTADYTTPAETLSGAITFKMTGEGVETDDIIQQTLKAWWTP